MEFEAILCKCALNMYMHVLWHHHEMNVIMKWMWLQYGFVLLYCALSCAFGCLRARSKQERARKQNHKFTMTNILLPRWCLDRSSCILVNVWISVRLLTLVACDSAWSCLWLASPLAQCVYMPGVYHLLESVALIICLLLGCCFHSYSFSLDSACYCLSFGDVRNHSILWNAAFNQSGKHMCSFQAISSSNQQTKVTHQEWFQTIKPMLLRLIVTATRYNINHKLKYVLQIVLLRVCIVTLGAHLFLLWLAKSALMKNLCETWYIPAQGQWLLVRHCKSSTSSRAFKLWLRSAAAAAPKGQQQHKQWQTSSLAHTVAATATSTTAAAAAAQQHGIWHQSL